MLSELYISQFTVFREAKFEFSDGLNVILGENGTGKTHLLKLAYLFARAWSDLRGKPLSITTKGAETYLAERMAGLFRVPDLDLLIRKEHRNGVRLPALVRGHIPTIRIRSMLEPVSYSAGLPEDMPWKLAIKRGKQGAGTLDAEVIPDRAAQNSFLPPQVFIPSKEIVSLFKGLIGLFETYRDFPLDLTYRDLAVTMSTLEPRQPSVLLPDVAGEIQKLLGGQLKLEEDDLVFVRNDGSTLLSQLLAEGHRKLAMLVYLLKNNLIQPGSTVYWDEPEANLNPAALRLLVRALHLLSGKGIQVILATHSLFLLREVELLQSDPKSAVALAPRYFGLGFGKRGVTVSQSEDMAAIDPLVMLDETIAQSDRYVERNL